jgi:DNA-directed RNA polymerase specialized sigma subunit
LEQKDWLKRAIASLPAKNREIIERYYFEEVSLEEIGDRMGLSKSWVCRIHAKSLIMLRETLAAQQSKGVSTHPKARNISSCYSDNSNEWQ